MDVILDFIINNITIVVGFIALLIPSPAGVVKKVVLILVAILKKILDKK